MESFPLPPEKEAKFVGDVTTNGLSWPGDAVRQASQADKEIGLWLDLRLLYLTTSPKHHCMCAFMDSLPLALLPRHSVMPRYSYYRVIGKTSIASDETSSDKV